MMNNIAISVKEVSKDFKINHSKSTTVKAHFVSILKGKKDRNIETQHALKNISFEIKKGEFFGIVGRNGSGKSTMLKILAGIYQPNKGSINVQGKLVPFIELGVGFNPELTGRENVFLNGALLGFSEAEVAAFYQEVVEFAELGQFMDKKLKNYSSGMQVRLAFSMAVRAEADILLVDEVLAVGDADFQRKCYEYFQRIKSQGVTVVFVTHDMSAIRQYCDRAALIDGSKLIDINSAEKIAKKYIQLFSEEKSQQPLSSKQTKRWGDKKATYSKVSAELVDNDKNILISATVKANKKVEGAYYGFMISNEARQSVLGTNSMIEQVKAEALKMGETISITWKFPNIFNQGKFYVELALMHNATQVSDWWEDATFFKISNEKRTPYIVNPKTEFTKDKMWKV